MALSIKALGKQVTVIDLDIVNPYFRTADFEKLFAENDIQLIAPLYANSNLDIPSLPGNVDSMLYDKDNDHYFVVDVGGDDAGAIALGRYSKALSDLEFEYDFFYVINCYRYLTQHSDEATGLLKDIEHYSRLKATKLINNSNLGEVTTKEDIIKSQEFANLCASETNLPIAFTTVDKNVDKDGEFDSVEIYVKPRWER